MAASLWRCSLPASTISPESVPVTAPVPDHAPEQPRASASLVLLRDGAAGMEVLLLRRHANSRVHGGLHVFPGGKLDAADCAADALATLDQDAATLHRRLGEPGLAPEHAAGIFLAALRETHEEAGLLLAEGATPARQAQLAAAQRSGQPLAVALRALGLRWQTRAVLPWSRWITPLNAGPRFDTRFFLAALPPGQQASHDGHEATEAIWLSPRQALERHRARELELLPPQLMSLVQLARHADLASARAEAMLRRPPCIQPEPVVVDGARAVCYPGDPLHPVRERALHGPTRLRWLSDRFEPFGGFDAWFD